MVLIKWDNRCSKIGHKSHIVSYNWKQTLRFEQLITWPNLYAPQFLTPSHVDHNIREY
jgi:hypothetical protein